MLENNIQTFNDFCRTDLVFETRNCKFELMTVEVWYLRINEKIFRFDVSVDD